jgi:hypothetical protein
VKRTILFTLLAFALGSGTAWATIVGTTNPNAFTQDYIDWCQYGCVFDSFAQPQPWVSNGGGTGTVGLHNPGTQFFYNLQQGNSWSGNFPAGMGLIYNGYVFGLIPNVGIVTTFNSGISGVGAYIQADIFGPFSATITLFDQNNNSLGSFTANGVSNGNVGTALFIGASSLSGAAYAAQFDVVDVNGNEDFAIGTVNFNSVPEPSTLLLFGSSAIGVAGLIRRRFKGAL